ncbi:hypothetical protein B9G54_02475 [Alloscardovia macacae]|uniref:HTH marR-type domain-containing protein n=1 Tax=Alloscardovia macacae TaxID=1160091 RepID=A0A1Y2T165_9BIFI|nr:ROK family transcriptional regulator [Alloscardovia macacae]OTA27125.1 hypothetical protein B9G54_02475 [Alloscardovia macacae]OTA29683.1 hypothetical protein B9T39_02280 [Alloscardovia macacae]
MSVHSLSPTEHAVLRAILRHDGVSRSQLAELVGVSMPTIASALKTLAEHRYVVQSSGAHASTGGRRSDAYSFAYSRCICVGVLVSKGTAHLLAMNLRGEVSSRSALNLDDFGTANFYDNLALAIESFVSSSHIDPRHLRGIGVTVTSLAALDEASENRLRHAIESRLHYPIRIMREPFALAAAETLFHPDIPDAACIYLNATMSSAFIRSGHYVRSATFIEHMTLYPAGYSLSSEHEANIRDISFSPRPEAPTSSNHRCSCGQYGCAQMFCSAQALLHSVATAIPGTFRISGTPSTDVYTFINAMRDGSYTHTKAFNTYLDALAQLIHNIRMVLPVPIILGGEVARYFDSSDLGDIRSRVRSLEPSLGFSPSNFTILKSACAPDQAIMGAAYVLAQDYLDSLLHS